MTFKPVIWRPIAAVLSAVNLASVYFAAAAAEPWHATLHATLAAAFGLWALHLRGSSSGAQLHDQLDVLASEVSNVRGELSETQERLDFAERLMAQKAEVRRNDPEQ